MRNAGHTWGNARWEAGNVRDCLNYYSGAPERLFGRQIPVAGGIDVTFHEPLGVVGIIVPWNFPMPILGWGIAPALAAGNTVVLKPAELTPLTAIRIGELALEAGLPEHVLTVIPGKGSVVGERFVTHPLVRKVCFTGSTEVGKRIMAGCAEQVKRVTLELGGKSANIVFADADIAAAAASAPYAVFDNAGQDCCARSRILVERSAYDEFLALLEPAVTGLRVLDPSDEASEMGPLISAAAAQHRARATSTRSRWPSPGRTPGGDGFWVPPTVVATEDPAARIWREEVFGPVVAVMPFDDEAHAVALANDTEYGLSGSIFTNDLGRGLRVARAVEAGNLSVNSHAVGALLDAVRRLQAVRPRPRARPGRAERVHRGEERLHRPLSRDGSTEGGTPWQDASRARSPSSPAAARASASRPCSRFVEEGAQVVIGDIDDERGHALVGQLGGEELRDVRPRRRDRQGAGRRAVPDRQGHLRLGRHRVQQRRHLAARRRLDPRHRARRLAAGAGGQPDQRLPVLQGGAALHARAAVRARSSTPRRSSR